MFSLILLFKIYGIKGTDAIFTQNQEKFVFSILYSKSVSDLDSKEILQPELTPGLKNVYDIEVMGKEIKVNLGLSWDQVEKFMIALEFPMGIKDLMELLDWKNRTKFRGKYINPLIEIGVISITISDKPNSPNQQYYLSQKGSALLSALKNRDAQLLKQF